MDKTESDPVHELCSLIEKELDYQKFLRLVRELNNVLSAKHSRLKKSESDAEKSD